MLTELFLKFHCWRASQLEKAIKLAKQAQFDAADDPNWKRGNEVYKMWHKLEEGYIASRNYHEAQIVILSKKLTVPEL